MRDIAYICYGDANDDTEAVFDVSVLTCSGPSRDERCEGTVPNAVGAHGIFWSFNGSTLSRDDIGWRAGLQKVLQAFISCLAYEQDCTEIVGATSLFAVSISLVVLDLWVS